MLPFFCIRQNGIYYTMNRCPSLQEWLDLAEARTQNVRALELRAHLETGCAACVAQNAWLGRVTAAFPAVRAPGLSEKAKLSLRELAAARLEAKARPLWIATLFRDTRFQQTVGARGGDEGVQLRYEADRYEIRLWAEPTATKKWYLIGQVYTRDENRFLVSDTVALISADGTAQVAVAEEAEFHLDAVSAGTYRLALRLPDAELLVPEITLEAV